MRKLSMIVATGLFAAPMLAQAMPLSDSLKAAGGDGNGKLVSQNGAKLEFTDWSMKLNLSVQDQFAYYDFDNEVDGRDDKSDFSLTLVRLKLSGDVLGGDWSYRVENDFVQGSQGNGRRGNELKDAWWQYNSSEEAKVRGGQFKVPFSRQELASDEAQQFATRGIVSNFFAPGRNQGAMVHGSVSDINYSAGVFNGESDGEGINRGGVDNKVLGSVAVNTNFGDYGDRNVEGDFRDNGDFAATVGAAALYGEGTTGFDDLDQDFSRADVNADVGIRVEGFSAQGEFYYSFIELDDLNVENDDADLFGFYVQPGYMLVQDEWELAFRFGYIEPDDDFVGGTPSGLLPVGIAEGNVDDAQEYNFSLNYYINGHALKLQTGVSWVVTNFVDSDDDITDVVYSLKIAGYV